MDMEAKDGTDELIRLPERNLVKDGVREKLLQRVEKMRTQAVKDRQEVLAKNFEKTMLGLARFYFEFNQGEYRKIPREEKEALCEMVHDRIRKKLKFWLGGNIVCGWVIALGSLLISSGFLLSLLPLGIADIFFAAILSDELGFLNGRRYAELSFSLHDKNGNGT